MFLFIFAEGGIQLVPDGTLFLHIGIILLMVYVLNTLLFKPINSALDKRTQSTQGSSHESRNILTRVEQGIGAYERSLREARAEGYALMERQRAEAIAERQNRLGALREEVNGSIEQEKRSINLQTEEARRTLAEDARRTAAEISKRVLRRPVTTV